MRTITTLAIAAVALTLGPGLAVAQYGQPAQARFGSHLAYHFDAKDPGLGIQADVPLTERFAAYPSGIVYLVDDGTLMALNADVKYRLDSPVYLGGGLNIMRRSINDADNTDAGLNLLAGVETQTGRFHPFAEGRLIFNDDSAFQLMAGLNIRLR